MTLVGTLSKEKSNKGVYTLSVCGTTVPVKGDIDKYAGQRVSVVVTPRWHSEIGSYLRVVRCWVTDEPDQNSVEVEGTIVGIYTKLSKKNHNYAGILLQLNRSSYSTVLVTAVSSDVDRLQPNNLSIGKWIRVSGNISSHVKGLQVLYMKTLCKEGEEDAR